MNYSGLTVRNGRLINERPDSKTGIQKMAEIKRAAKVAAKVAVHVEAMQVAKHQSGGCDCGSY